MQVTVRPRGGQTVYTPELAERVCELIAQGKTLRQIEEMEGMPHKETINGWAIDDRDGFAARYARAQRIRTYSMRDEINETAERDDLDPKDKQVRIDAKKWLMAKTMPKEFGDRIQHEHSGTITLAGVLAAVDEPLTIEGKAEEPGND